MSLLSSHYSTYDAFAVAREGEQHLPDWPAVERRAIEVIKTVYHRNSQARKPDPFHCCAIHRTLGIHRWFNLTKPDVLGMGGPEYGGAMNHAVSLISGEWRVGTLEEEAARRKQDADESAAELKRREEVKAVEHRAAGAQMAQSFMDLMAKAQAQNAAPKPEEKDTKSGKSK